MFDRPLGFNNAISARSHTDVGVAHDQRRLGVFGLELDQLLERGRRQPAHPLAVKRERLDAGRLRHQLEGDSEEAFDPDEAFSVGSVIRG